MINVWVDEKSEEEILADINVRLPHFRITAADILVVLKEIIESSPTKPSAEFSYLETGSEVELSATPAGSESLLVTLSWTFVLKELGTQREQAEYILKTFIKPLMVMASTIPYRPDQNTLTSREFKDAVLSPQISLHGTDLASQMYQRYWQVVEEEEERAKAEAAKRVAEEQERSRRLLALEEQHGRSPVAESQGQADKASSRGMYVETEEERKHREEVQERLRQTTAQPAKKKKIRL
mmetsp:Transcript_32104/g.51879  ORF Transcript_32104/g.51879 Transcript_32104/m.51879 type:complete len:238 (+) Transcript_32104:144-857(+)